MKDYKRLTNPNLEEYYPKHDFCLGCEHFENHICKRWNGNCANYEDFNRVYDRLFDLEDKIESGELISTVQSEQGEQEVAYFAKHNAAVRKQAVKEFSDKILSVSKITFCAFTDARMELSLAEYKQLIKEACGE